ncbi:hypothetical protein QQZ08_011262 [Neonectria magnoliae]|uniref:Uncharacterized protein n=1 Tax=Neonectria magnoliae TaxID=2732573 RepID=A0ABR1HC24_9HYPO
MEDALDMEMMDMDMENTHISPSIPPTPPQTPPQNPLELYAALEQTLQVQWLSALPSCAAALPAMIRAQNLSPQAQHRELEQKADLCLRVVQIAYDCEALAWKLGHSPLAELYRANGQELAVVYEQLNQAIAELEAKSWKWGAALDQIATCGQEAATEFLRGATRGSRREYVRRRGIGRGKGNRKH